MYRIDPSMSGVPAEITVACVKSVSTVGVLG